MNLLTTRAVLVFSLCFTQGFAFFGLDTGYRHMAKEFSSMANIDRSSDVETKWIEQPLDHFNKKETRTWNMRYFENIEHFKSNGPIFLFIGGESAAEPRFLATGTMYELAKETNGAMFASEHRYYGISMPLPNNVTENLKYLSSSQALADLENLIKSLKSERKTSKVVVVGGSYPGNLAAWARQLYPEIIDAAISSSAPVLAKKDFYEYLEVVSNNYKQYGLPGCWDKISEIFQRYQRLLNTKEGIEQLKREENICEYTDMTLLESQQRFFNDKMRLFKSNSQYGTPELIQDHCKEIIHSSRVVSSLPTFDGQLYEDCQDYTFQNGIDVMKTSDHYPWVYQTCTEFGYYKTTNSKSHPFTQSVNLEYYIKICTALFGPEFDEKRVDKGVENSNARYHGLKPDVKHVVFVNGDMDPWHRLGVLKDLSNDAPTKVIHGTSHCKDLYPEDKPEELKKARVYVKNLIKKWIGHKQINE